MNNRLKVLRAERHWSQADLAQRLDVSRQSVNAIETGKYDPSLPLAFRIARTDMDRIEAHRVQPFREPLVEGMRPCWRGSISTA